MASNALALSLQNHTACCLNHVCEVSWLDARSTHTLKHASHYKAVCSLTLS
jgi:hypothetical protein